MFRAVRLSYTVVYRWIRVIPHLSTPPGQMTPTVAFWGRHSWGSSTVPKLPPRGMWIVQEAVRVWFTWDILLDFSPVCYKPKTHLSKISPYLEKPDVMLSE